MAIKVFGIGSAGIAALRHVAYEKPADCQLVAIDTNFQVLISPDADDYVWIGSREQGTGGNPTRGQDAAKSSIQHLRSALESVNCLYLMSVFGGGTGTGASQVVAALAKSLKIPVVAVIALPYSFEGQQRLQIAQEGTRRLRPMVEDIVVIQSDQWLRLMPPKKLNLKTAFALQARVLAWNTLACF
jgi:cell division protein FtsZ